MPHSSPCFGAASPRWPRHLSSATVTQPDYDFSERVIVVTGGSAGSGPASWRLGRRRGARRGLRRHEAEVEGALFVAADVRKPPDAERV